jgi:hypothetical protein
MQRMSVTITDPPDNDSFPYDEGWTATATIDSADAVDGTLLDLNTNEVYPSNNTSGVGPDPGTGLYTWQVPFTPDANIWAGDPLMIYCYDAEISGDGDTHADTASADGLDSSRSKQREPLASSAGAPSIGITTADLSGTTVSVTVKLTPQQKGGIFLMLAHYTGDIKKITKSVHVHRLSASQNDTRNHSFLDIDASKWTHISVIAVTYRHRGAPKAKCLKGGQGRDASAKRR